MNTVRKPRSPSSPYVQYTSASLQAPHTPLPKSIPAFNPTQWCGKTIAGKYCLEECIAKGGMGWVFRARCVHLEQEGEFFRAIKIIDPRFFQNQDALVRFKREVSTTLVLSESCERIVRVYDDFQFDVQQQFGYYVMELLQGETLATRLLRIQSEKTLPDIVWCVGIVYQICEAMEIIHSQQIVHCDLKPDNIFLAQQSRSSQQLSASNNAKDFVKLLDFGIARRMTPTVSTSSDHNFMVGTIPYMSPEQITGCDRPIRSNVSGKTGQANLDGCSDIYALGCVLFEMLTGRPPFPLSPHATVQESNRVLQDHQHQRPPYPESLRQDISPQLSQIVLRMLAKSPIDRYSSTKELQTALQPWLSHPSHGNIILTPHASVPSEAFIPPSSVTIPPLPTELSPTPPHPVVVSNLSTTRPSLSSTKPIPPEQPVPVTIAPHHSLHRGLYIAAITSFLGTFILGILFVVMIFRMNSHSMIKTVASNQNPHTSSHRPNSIPTPHRSALFSTPPSAIGKPSLARVSRAQSSRQMPPVLERSTIATPSIPKTRGVMLKPHRKYRSKPGIPRRRKKTCTLRISPKGYLDTHVLQFSQDPGQPPQPWKSKHGTFQIPCKQEIHITVNRRQQPDDFHPCTFLLAPMSPHRPIKQLQLIPIEHRDRIERGSSYCIPSSTTQITRK